jgi:hypothetical protein
VRSGGGHISTYLEMYVPPACRSLRFSACPLVSGAIEDLSVAIEVEPRYADSWKRRGQVRSSCPCGPQLRLCVHT